MGTQNCGFVAAVVFTGFFVIAAQNPARARDDHSHSQSGPKTNFTTSNKGSAASVVQSKIKQQPSGVNKSGTEPPSNRMLTSSKSASTKALQYKNYTKDKNSNPLNAKQQQEADQKRDQLQKEADKQRGQEQAERTSTSGGGGAGGSSGGGSQDTRKENAPKDAGDKQDARPNKEPQLPDDHSKLKPATGVSGASSQDVHRTRNCTNC